MSNKARLHSWKPIVLLTPGKNTGENAGEGETAGRKHTRPAWHVIDSIDTAGITVDR